ncbi:MAG: hypothetical protein R6X16_13535, partial [Anaerolineae bacterium]
MERGIHPASGPSPLPLPFRQQHHVVPRAGAMHLEQRAAAGGNGRRPDCRAPYLWRTYATPLVALV